VRRGRALGDIAPFRRHTNDANGLMVHATRQFVYHITRLPPGLPLTGGRPCICS
jgi:hypothetical protein